jgi:hypothetical protein
MLKIDQRFDLSFCLGFCCSGCYSRRESASVFAVAFAFLVVIPTLSEAEGERTCFPLVQAKMRAQTGTGGTMSLQFLSAYKSTARQTNSRFPAGMTTRKARAKTRPAIFPVWIP